MGRWIPLRDGRFTLRGRPMEGMERREMRLAHLFKPNMMLRFGHLHFLLRFSLISFFF